MINIRQKIVNEAMRYVGTRFLHQGRRRLEVLDNNKVDEGGIDCIGIVENIAYDVERVPEGYERITNYGPDPTGTMRRMMAKYLVLRPREWNKPGTICFIQFGEQRASHTGILTGYGTLIHAYKDFGFVVESTFAGAWERKTVARFDLPGVD